MVAVAARLPRNWGEARCLTVKRGCVRANVLGRAACALELQKLVLVSEHARASSAVPEAPVARHAERKVQVGALHADPVAHTLFVLLAILAGSGTRAATGGTRLAARRALFVQVLPHERRLRALHLLLVAQEVLRLSVEIGLGLLLVAPIAFVPAAEVVILTLTADPAAVRKRKLSIVLVVPRLLFVTQLHAIQIGALLERVLHIGAHRYVEVRYLLLRRQAVLNEVGKVLAQKLVWRCPRVAFVVLSLGASLEFRRSI